MRKGFTLIELLAVIVILSIIALIATPLILNVIDDAKKGAFKNSAYGIIQAAELHYLLDNINGENAAISYKYENGEQISPEIELDIKGKKPQNGVVKINNKGAVGIAIHDGTYCAKRWYDDSDLIVEKVRLEECYLAPKGYVLARDEDFQLNSIEGEHGTINYYQYTGGDEYVVVPDEIDGTEITSYFYMFYNTYVKGVASTNPNVTSMVYMFTYNFADTLDLRYLDTSGVTDMSNMFTLCGAPILDLSNFDTSKVTNMANMFADSYATEINVSGFDTSNVTNMSGMFTNSQAPILDLKNFNTSKVTNMSNMFFWSKATTINVSNFNTSNVTDMSSMFEQSKATLLDLSSFDTANVTNMNLMFSGSQATVGYARNQAEANKFNASSDKPYSLTFTVKP